MARGDGMSEAPSHSRTDAGQRLAGLHKLRNRLPALNAELNGYSGKSEGGGEYPTGHLPAPVRRGAPVLSLPVRACAVQSTEAGARKQSQGDDMAA